MDAHSKLEHIKCVYYLIEAALLDTQFYLARANTVTKHVSTHKAHALESSPSFQWTMYLYNRCALLVRPRICARYNILCVHNYCESACSVDLLICTMNYVCKYRWLQRNSNTRKKRSQALIILLWCLYFLMLQILLDLF